jgi:anti-sigma B factor antagonist
MNITNLKLSGELNIYAAAETQQAVQQALLEGGSALSLDLSDVSELDTAGVQQLLLLHRECVHSGRPLRLAASSPAVDETLALLGLRKLFQA